MSCVLVMYFLLLLLPLNLILLSFLCHTSAVDPRTATSRRHSYQINYSGLHYSLAFTLAPPSGQIIQLIIHKEPERSASVATEFQSCLQLKMLLHGLICHLLINNFNVIHLLSCCHLFCCCVKGASGPSHGFCVFLFVNKCLIFTL